MRRPAAEARTLERIESWRKQVPDLTIRSTFIVGFPGETEEMHAWGLERLSTLPWHRLHVFPYSEREGTAATRLDQGVAPQDRKRRVRELMALSRTRLRGHYARVLESGRPLSVLVEGPAPTIEGLEKGAWFSGYTANYYRVLLPASEAQGATGAMVSVQPTGLRETTAAGDFALIAHCVEGPDQAGRR